MIRSRLWLPWRRCLARPLVIVFTVFSLVSGMLPASTGAAAATPVRILPAATVAPSAARPSAVAPATAAAEQETALPAGVDDDWWGRVQAGIAREMHFILPATEQAAGADAVYQAHNAATNLAITFGA